MESINLLYNDKQDLLEMQQQLAHHPRQQILIQVFSGIMEKAALIALRQELIDCFPGVALLGVTTHGEIIRSRITEQRIILCFSIFNETQVATHAIQIDPDESLAQAGSRLRQQIEETDPKVAIVFSSGMHNEQVRDDSTFIAALCQNQNPILFAGGQAGAEEYAPHVYRTFVFTEHMFIEQGSVAATLTNPNLKCWSYKNDGWVPIGRKMRITRLNNNQVYTIDHRSIQEIYKTYLNIDYDLDDQHHPTWEFPLVTQRQGMLMKNIPIRQNPDGSFVFMHKFEKNELVRFSFCDISLLEDEALTIRNKLQSLHPEAIFIYSCSGRKQIFGKQITIDSRDLDLVASAAGFFTSTEYFTTPDYQVHCLIQTMTILALSESDELFIPPEPLTMASRPQDGHQRTTRLLKILTHLIFETSKELEQSNQKLQAMANIDNMTGLYNRRYFDKKLTLELKRHGRNASPLSLILLDIDFFKQFNDHYGHVAGDECLAAIGKTLTQSLHRPADIAFRYGGEEMGCLLPDTDQEGAQALAEQLRDHIEQLHIPHVRSKVSDSVTASVGFVTLSPTRLMQVDEKQLIRHCDQMLYQAKHQGRNQVRGKRIHDEIRDDSK
ncbi:diguanylate cyclase domain-containing protein [Celerinatantimonas sp. YJH-8]|uniref:sensor domain-containing diguanylate cyclase n=1 Tax=Celerinatantimonas sp. YJH-8 TaxID=3228714 RepID=UPI0038C6B59E